MKNVETPTEEKKRFQFADHPWITLFVFVLTYVFLLSFTGHFFYYVLDLPRGHVLHKITYEVLVLAVFAPLVFRIPNGNRTYLEYLHDIRITNYKPLGWLLLLSVTCWLIFTLSQGLGTIVFRMTEGKIITGEFLLSVFDLTQDLPPKSLSLVNSIEGEPEELLWRGIILTLFLRKYPKWKSIVVSVFGLQSV